MKCKYCQAELEEGSTVCPECGMDNAEMPELEVAGCENNAEMPEQEAPAEEAIPETSEQGKEKKAGKILKIVLASVAGVVLLAMLAWVVYYGVTGSFLPKENDLYYKDSYIADLSTAAKVTKFQKQMDTVVATMGDATLTNSQLQVFYWMEVKDYLSYASSYGYDTPDTSLPLSEQVYDETTGQTWEQYFLEMTLEVWKQYQLMTNEANAAGYVMPEAYSSQFDTLEADLTEAAETYGYDSLEAFLTAEVGAGAQLQSYRDYLLLYYTASLYYSEMMGSLEVTEEEAEAFYTKNANYLYYYYGVTAASGKSVDVRHILIMPEGGTKDSSTGYTNYTDEEWEDCRVLAQGIYDEWLSGEEVSEETFAEFAVKYSEDGNASEGGIYTEVYEGTMVTAFNDWCFDESRQPGDHGLVKTEFGYHIMYFVGSGEGINSTVLAYVQNEKAADILDDLVEKNTMTVDYKSIVLGEVDLT